MIYYNNLSAFTEVHYGNTNIDEVYFGNNKVWPEGPTPFGGKFKAIYSDGREYEKDCDGDTILRTGDTRPSGYNYTAMTEAIIGNCVTTIDDGAFESCSALTSVSISGSVTSIVQYAFNNCRNLTSVNIPSGVTVLTEGVFHMCSSLTSITIPDRVTSIGSSTFGYCISLTGITIPDSVTTIYNNAFSRCTSLTSITIPDNVTTIGEYAFSHCTGLTGITVESTTPPTLGDTAFDDTNNCPIYVPCESIEAYKTATNWSRYADRIQCVLPTTALTYSASSKLEVDLTAFTPAATAETFADGVGKIEFAGDVTEIGGMAFNRKNALTSIGIPDSVVSIGYDAFVLCNLSNIVIPSSVTTIGSDAFLACGSLTSITFLSSTPPTIGWHAFEQTYCPIYVPAESVEAYKTASTYWEEYADRIQAIQ